MVALGTTKRPYQSSLLHRSDLLKAAGWLQKRKPGPQPLEGPILPWFHKAWGYQTFLQAWTIYECGGIADSAK
jgi:hypothetical protein